MYVAYKGSNRVIKFVIFVFLINFMVVDKMMEGCIEVVDSTVPHADEPEVRWRPIYVAYKGSNHVNNFLNSKQRKF